jgi:hypothetical protein
MRRVLGGIAAVLAFVAATAETAQGASSMTVTSSVFKDGGTIPVKYTCDGTDVSPPLAFGKVPKKTVELVLIVDDPDAPNGRFVHWLLYNVYGSTKAIGEGARPAGAREGKNGFGSQGWRGPCPPIFQTHRYYFTAHALRKRSGLQTGAEAAAVRSAINGKVLATGSLMGRYGCDLIACLIR